MPVNINTYLASLFGDTTPITDKNFSEEDLTSLRETIKRKQQFNKDRQESLKYQQLDTPSEYRRSPEYSLVPKTPGSTTLISQETPYSVRQDNLKNQEESYRKNPNKISVSYGDYNVKSGENAAPVGQNTLSALFQSFTDPAFRLASTLGSFNAYDEGDKYRVEDQYGFKSGQQWFYNNASKDSTANILKKYWNTPGALGEILFHKLKGDTTRPVNFYINK